MSATSVRERLAAGPARGLGCANKVAEQALQSPEMVKQLVDVLRDQRALVTHRASNALRKVQQARPELVTRYGHRILLAAIECSDLQTRWNLTIVAGRLPLRGQDRALAVELMFEALRSASAFLRVFALSGLVELAANDAELQKRVRPMVEIALDDTSAAMRARARKLLPKVRWCD